MKYLVALVILFSACTYKHEFNVRVAQENSSEWSNIECDSFKMISKEEVDIWVNGKMNTIKANQIIAETNGIKW